MSGVILSDQPKLNARKACTNEARSNSGCAHQSGLFDNAAVAVPIGTVTPAAAVVWAGVTATAVVTPTIVVVRASVVTTIGRTRNHDSWTSLLSPVYAPFHQFNWPAHIQDFSFILL